MTIERWSLFGLLVGLVVSFGCSPAPTPAPRDAEKKEGDAAQADAAAPLLEPFDPPPLDEIDANAEWVDRPVRNALKDLTEYLAERPRLVDDAAALKLRNDSDEANEKILSALGRQPSSPDEVDWNATFLRRLNGEARSTNPLLMSSVSEFDIAGYTSTGLFSFDWTMKPFASAETVVEWKTSKDGMLDKVVLRDDMTWSDGRPVTAHDVAFSFQVIMDPRVPIPAVRSGTDELRWVHAYDDRTVVYFHKKSLATNVWNINFPIVPKHVYEKSYQEDPTLAKSPYHAKLEADPVTGGPYVIESRQSGGVTVLRRRESYYMHEGKQVRDKPYFDVIRFRVIEDPNTALLAVKSGEIDETLLSPDQWTNQTNDASFYNRNTKVREIEWTSFHFVWNTKSRFFGDVRVRKAMSYAFDYEELLDRLCYGLYEPSAGMFYRDSWMAPKDFPEPYRQDLDKAEDLLDEAGWVDSDGDGYRDKNGVRFEFTVLCPNEPDRVRYCDVLRQSLEKIGVVCNIRPLEFTVLISKLQQRDFECAFGGWGTGTDPDTTRNIWGTGEARNYAQYSNPEVDALYEQGAAELDLEKRAEIYGKIHKILYEDQPYTYLFWRASFYGFNKSLRGYHMSPRGPFNYGPGASAFWKIAR